MTHKNELMSANTHQNVMKLKYDVNGYYARLWFTSDDFWAKSNQKWTRGAHNIR